jgi:hypothetical protein
LNAGVWNLSGGKQDLLGAQNLTEQHRSDGVKAENRGHCSRALQHYEGISQSTPRQSRRDGATGGQRNI